MLVGCGGEENCSALEDVPNKTVEDLDGLDVVVLFLLIKKLAEYPVNDLFQLVFLVGVKENDFVEEGH